MDEKLGSIKYMYVFMIFINGRGGGGRGKLFKFTVGCFHIEVFRLHGFVHMYRYKLQSVVIMFEEKLP